MFVLAEISFLLWLPLLPAPEDALGCAPQAGARGVDVGVCRPRRLWWGPRRPPPSLLSLLLLLLVLAEDSPILLGWCWLPREWGIAVASRLEVAALIVIPGPDAVAATTARIPPLGKRTQHSPSLLPENPTTRAISLRGSEWVQEERGPASLTRGERMWSPSSAGFWGE